MHWLGSQRSCERSPVPVGFFYPTILQQLYSRREIAMGPEVITGEGVGGNPCFADRTPEESDTPTAET